MHIHAEVLFVRRKTGMTEVLSRNARRSIRREGQKSVGITSEKRMTEKSQEWQKNDTKTEEGETNDRGPAGNSECQQNMRTTEKKNIYFFVQ